LDCDFDSFDLQLRKREESRMKIKNLMAVLITAAMIAPAVAGDYKCTAGTQECLNAMAEKLKNKGWVGIELDQDEETGALTVRLVVEESPAQTAGFKPGDKLVAMNDLKFGEASEEALHQAWDKMTPGTDVVYTVSRDGKEAKLDVTLAKLPEDVMAKWVGQHMLEHATVATAQK